MGALSYVLSLLMGELPFNGRRLGAGEPKAPPREHPRDGRNGLDSSESFKGQLRQIPDIESPFNGRRLGAGEPKALRREHPGNGWNGPDRSEPRKGQLRRQIPDIEPPCHRGDWLVR